MVDSQCTLMWASPFGGYLHNSYRHCILHNVVSTDQPKTYICALKFVVIFRSKCVRCGNVLRTGFIHLNYESWRVYNHLTDIFQVMFYYFLICKKNLQPYPPKRCIYKFPETHRWYVWIDVKVESKLPRQNYKSFLLLCKPKQQNACINLLTMLIILLQLHASWS